WTTTSVAGTTGSRKISSVPPDRHGLCTTTAPGSAAAGPTTPASGVIRNSTGSRDASTASPRACTLAPAHPPPPNPTLLPPPRTPPIVPSACPMAVAPALAEVGRSALTTVASTYGSRRAASSSALARTSAAESIVTPTISADREVGPERRALNGPPHLGRGQR